MQLKVPFHLVNSRFSFFLVVVLSATGPACQECSLSQAKATTDVLVCRRKTCVIQDSSIILAAEYPKFNARCNEEQMVGNSKEETQETLFMVSHDTHSISRSLLQVLLQKACKNLRIFYHTLLIFV